MLPVGSRIGGRQQQYVWDGKAIKIIDTEELASKQTKRQHLSSQLREWRRGVQSSFLPDKDLVTGDYWAYSFWRNSHRFFSSATTVFATQVSMQNQKMKLHVSQASACKAYVATQPSVISINILCTQAHFPNHSLSKVTLAPPDDKIMTSVASLAANRAADACCHHCSRFTNTAVVHCSPFCKQWEWEQRTRCLQQLASTGS